MHTGLIRFRYIGGAACDASVTCTGYTGRQIDRKRDRGLGATRLRARSYRGGPDMPRDTEQAVICLHSVRIGDMLYSGLSEVRARMRGRPAGESRLKPVERAGQRAHPNGVLEVWVGTPDEGGR